MNLVEALESAREGNFVTHEIFDSEQSLHFYNHKYYYEDGAVIPDDYLYSQDWAVKRPWFIKIPKNEINTEILKNMHEKSKGFMLQDSSYEDCRINQKQ